MADVPTRNSSSPFPRYPPHIVQEFSFPTPQTGPWAVARVGAQLRVAAVAVFVALAMLATFWHSTLLRLDQPLSESVRGTALQDQFGAVTTLGATEVAWGLAMLFGVALWFRCRTLALIYPVTLVVGTVVNISLKALIGRPRPPTPDTGVSLASFPSGHTIQATLLFGLLPVAVWVLTERPIARRVAVVVAAAGIAAVGLSRVYLGAHWPTDVVGGVLVGLALVAGGQRVMRRWHRPACTCALDL